MQSIKSKPCPECGAVATIPVKLEELIAYEGGALIQNAFPTMSADDRERLMTGFCPACWNRLFPEEED